MFSNYFVCFLRQLLKAMGKYYSTPEFKETGRCSGLPKATEVRNSRARRLTHTISHPQNLLGVKYSERRLTNFTLRFLSALSILITALEALPSPPAPPSLHPTKNKHTPEFCELLLAASSEACCQSVSLPSKPSTTTAILPKQHLFSINTSQPSMAASCLLNQTWVPEHLTPKVLQDLPPPCWASFMYVPSALTHPTPDGWSPLSWSLCSLAFCAFLHFN